MSHILNLVSDESGELIESIEVSDEDYLSWERAAEAEGLSVEAFLEKALFAILDNMKKDSP